jgi:hypothetical protein
MRIAQSTELSQGSNTKKATQAHKVPTVPGAQGDKPEPSPNAIHRAGCRLMNCAVGRKALPVVTVWGWLAQSVEGVSLMGD